MGQYYVIVNLDKKQYIHPHKFGDGMKLLEFADSTPGTMTALAVLLADGNGRGGGDLDSENLIIGSWAGDRIVIAGDYADPGKFVPKDMKKKLFERNLEGYSQNSPGMRASDKKKCAKATANLHFLAEAFFEDISEKVILAITDDRWLGEELIKSIPEEVKKNLAPQLVEKKLAKSI